MKSRQRRNFSAEMKARIALEAIKEQKTIQEIASHYGLHPQPGDELEAASDSRSAGTVRGSAVAARHERGSAEGGVVPADWTVAGGAGLA
jgi:transposase-like protein